MFNSIVKDIVRLALGLKFTFSLSIFPNSMKKNNKITGKYHNMAFGTN